MRRHQHHRLSRTAVTALVVCGVAIPNAAATQQVDLRSPDTRDAAVAAGATLDTSNLVPPDARAVSAQSSSPSIDLRSPDARSAEIEAARGPVAVAPVRVDRVVEASGFDWSDFGIGVAAAMGAVLLGFGALSMAHRGRAGGSGPSPLAS